MATQDEYIKTALRLPRSLHADIQASAERLGRSMNAEIIARLQSSFDAETVADSTPSTGMVITVDARGYPISWSEISAYVDAFRQMSGVDPRSLKVNVITPGLMDSDGRDPKYDAIERNLKEFYRKKRAASEGAQPDPAPHSESPRTITKKGSSGKPHTTTVVTKK